MLTAVASPSSAAPVSLTLYRGAASLYYDAQRCFTTGDLEACRDQAERALLVFLHSADSTPQSSSGNHEERPCVSAEEADTLFANLLLLLSLVYSAAWAYHEADRLLATASDYVQERLRTPSLATAAILYNRATLRLEQVRLSHAPNAVLTPSEMALVHEAKVTYLLPAAEYLTEVVGPGRLLLADVLHSLGTCCVLRGEWTDALQHYQRSLDVRVRSYNALERELRKQTAESTADDAQERLRPLLPRRDVTELKLALTLEHVAQLYRLTPNDPTSRRHSLRCLTRALETRRQWLGPQHGLVLDTCMSLAAVAVEVGELNCARSALRDVMENAPADEPGRSESAARCLAQLE